MRELDVVLLNYLETIYPDAPCEEQAAFRRCLELQDPEILDLLTGRETGGDEVLARVVEKIRTAFRPAAS
jgi:succinate dehydrogenase flavin-adding protein (antitoxin of CptAB toxin-antitoxin module)